MCKPAIVSLFAVATTILLCSAPHKMQARESDTLVVVGQDYDTIAISHPAPEYPYDAQRMRIQGDVQVLVHVENGRMMKVKATSKSPYLAGISERWISRHWRFASNVNGDYIVPIVYRLRGASGSA
jgi:Gram-negative bacterial TonB protein C-terminal